MITRLLVANRGEIARRVFATCRALGIATVAVYSDADADAPHVARGRPRGRLPGNAPAETYLRGDLIVAAARPPGADAVHPGYGFLAENADFAAAVLDAGLIWVGPPPKAIAAMGSKLEAKALLGRGRRADAAVVDRARPGDRVPGAGQGVGRRRRAGHADRPDRRRAGRGDRGRPARGGGRLRRRHRVLRALRRDRPPHRGADLRRHPRHRASPSASGSARSSAGTRRSSRSRRRRRSTTTLRAPAVRRGRGGRPGGRLRRRRHGRVPARRRTASSSSWR